MQAAAKSLVAKTEGETAEKEYRVVTRCLSPIAGTNGYHTYLYKTTIISAPSEQEAIDQALKMPNVTDAMIAASAEFTDNLTYGD